MKNKKNNTMSEQLENQIEKNYRNPIEMFLEIQ
jgi:hypothetical protein